MELKIKYENGQMCVYVENFLDMRSIGKFKKLLKVIDTSYTPEARDELKAYIMPYLENVEERLRLCEKRSVDARTHYKELFPELERLIYKRDTYCRNTPPYKYFSQKIKEKRAYLKDLKTVWKVQERYFDEAFKNKVFYEKCLKLLS